MNQKKHSIKTIVQVAWQLPQNIVGYAILKVIKPRYRCHYKDATIYTWTRDDGVSLGKYIFVPAWANASYIKHEYGHTVQSCYLGWFYLAVIGLPSILWAGLGRNYRKKHNVSYYSFYTEKWADKLGGVERKIKAVNNI